ncbi:MAG: tRNA (N(6)-L-threonylcarbamoyladenosine(37)-C(2))-methylthiotransferase MtaB [Lentisphaeria bacterium]|nr:tRNA (N(6)-L-threonylcarbamoyladenosine(37)-C(2))-methylthiotransferase MtaB [Lentisphaeria bacterium]
MTEKTEKFAAIYTLGCRLNSADTALMHSRLSDANYTLKEIDYPQLDLIIINGCAVTALAAKKSRQIAKKMRQIHPDSVIIATGCSAKIDDISNIADYVLYDKRNLVDLLAKAKQKSDEKSIRHFSVTFQEKPSEFDENDFSNSITFQEKNVGSFPFNSRAFIKIQEGCNNFCTYCIVPHVRGRERSRNFDEILADVRNAIENGYPEIILTGVNSCAYNDHGRNLTDLLREIVKIDGNYRIRLSSTEPKMDNLELLYTMAELGDKICRFLHLSMQHGSDEILKKMNRHYSFAEYRKFVEKARELIPDIHIGTDIIVGFPQESEENFKECCIHTEELQFANSHLFSYSKRAGTPAASMSGQIDSVTIKRRYNELKKITDTSAEKFAKSFVGKQLPVIFEEVKSDGMLHGWSDNYLPIKIKPENIAKEAIIEVKIIKYCPDGTLLAEV